MSPKWIKRIIVTLIAVIFAFSLFHASWLAPDPQGRPKLIASTPLDLPRDTQGCVITAATGYGATAVSAETKMLQTAVGNGADGIVIDSEIVDGKPVLPRFFASDCPAKPATPPLTEALTALTKPDQFVRVHNAAHAKAVLAALPSDDLTRIFFGPKEAEVAAFKGKPAFSIGKARRCAQRLPDERPMGQRSGRLRGRHDAANA